MKYAFIFSGQGAQYVGMGKQLYDEFPAYRRVYEDAEDALGFSIADITFNDEKKLNETEFCQPAILAMSMAIAAVLGENGIKAEMTAGLSLGEYSALTYADVYDFKDAVRLVQKRGRFMQDAVKEKPGAMCAIMGSDAVTVEMACRNVSTSQSMVYVANYNAPDQIVISGAHEAVRLASMAAQQQGAKKAIMLNVTGAFHTPMFTGAAELLKKELIKIKPRHMRIPVVTNVDADPVRYEADLPDILYKQMISPVRFYQSIQTMVSSGVTTFVEIGPGKTLTSLVKRIDKRVTAINVEDTKTLKEAIKLLTAGR